MSKPSIKRRNAEKRRGCIRPRTLFLSFLLALLIFISLFFVLGNNQLSFGDKQIFITLTGTHPAPCSLAATKYVFGTLETDPAKASQECAAGVQVATQTVGWENYEPSDGVFNEAYMDDVKNRIKMDLTAGLKVVISPAIHYPPAWVMALPGAQYVNQYGIEAPISSGIGQGEPNFIFSQTVRSRAARFETRVMQQLANDPAIGLKNIWAVRYVNGSSGETLYPSANDQKRHVNSYWAYDINAQGQGSDRPATIPANPFPGWKPGEKTYNGQPFSTLKVMQWYDWYFNAHTDFVNWHTSLYRDPHGINYQGYLQLLMPGFGARAFEYNGSITHYLDGSQDRNTTVARAAIWYKLFPALSNRKGIVAYVSSMADGSGSPQENSCHDGDAAIDYSTDPRVNNWSAVRYIAGLADKYSMPKNGENPGIGDMDPGTISSRRDLHIMKVAAAQMQFCKFQGMFWAHDADLYNDKVGATLHDYANIISWSNTSHST
ncbi:MAG: beta-galactosidase [Ktedonobacteraceae bacterium]|nr:beta-galactosidase [Ktedonobacteraceae bacterium]